MTAEWYDLNNLDLGVFQSIERSVMYCADKAQGPDALTVTNDITKMSTRTRAFVAFGKMKGEPPVAVTSGYEGGAYSMWISPTFPHNSTGAEFTVVHELCHAYVGCKQGHGPAWRNLFYHSLERWAGTSGQEEEAAKYSQRHRRIYGG